MAESVNGGGGPNQPPKEMSMEVRLLLTFLLMGAVMFPHALPFQDCGAAARQKGGAVRAGPSGHPAAAGPGGRSASAGGREGQGRAAGQEGFLQGRPIRSHHPTNGRAGFDRRYRPVHGRLQQPGRHRTELASQEIPRQRRANISSW